MCRNMFSKVGRRVRLVRGLAMSASEANAANKPISDYSTRTTRNRIYGWGLAANGELGVIELIVPKHHIRPLDNTHVPIRIPLCDKQDVRAVACGYGFSVFICKEKSHYHLYGTGVNTSGQLGFHPVADKKKAYDKQATDKQGTADKQAAWLVKPQLISLPLKNSKAKLTHVACGLGHTVVAVEGEGLLAMGNNCHGQCGRKPIDNEDYSTSLLVHRIRDFSLSVKKLICGLDHNLVLTDDGRVFGFGLGTDGQLGDNKFESNWIPTELGGNLKGERIVDVASSGDCCLAVSDKGEVFGWGNSEYKQLSTATSGIQVGVPTKLKLDVGKVKKVASGGSVCLLLTESGQVYTWGYGYLGLGPDTTLKTAPTLVPAPLFGANVYRPDVVVKDIFAGVLNFAAINSDGELYMWGKNHLGSLGFRHENEQFFPLKVDVGYTTLSVSMGPFHTIALVRTSR